MEREAVVYRAEGAIWRVEKAISRPEAAISKAEGPIWTADLAIAGVGRQLRILTGCHWVTAHPQEGLQSGTLHLRGLQRLSIGASEALSKHCGELDLHDLKSIPPSAIYLFKNKVGTVCRMNPVKWSIWVAAPHPFPATSRHDLSHWHLATGNVWPTSGVKITKSPDLKGSGFHK